MKFTMTRKKWPFNTGDCLIEVTSYKMLNLYEIYYDRTKK